MLPEATNHECAGFTARHHLEQDDDSTLIFATPVTRPCKVCRGQGERIWTGVIAGTEGYERAEYVEICPTCGGSGDEPQLELGDELL